MRIIISSLLLILALHFLLQGINYRKHIKLYDTNSGINSNINSKINNLNENEYKINNLNEIESFQDDIDVRQELLSSIECEESEVSASNKYVDDKNDANFQSNVLNVNKFYKKNLDDTNVNEFINNKNDSKNINSFSNISQYSNQPVTWNYKDELVMNGGELINGITGYDNITDQYFTYGETSILKQDSSNKSSCTPSSMGAKIDDDIRMGLGKLNIDKRLTT